MEKSKTSKYRGVHWCTEKAKWVATISVNKKSRHLGYFDSEESARDSYIAAYAEKDDRFFPADLDGERWVKRTAGDRVYYVSNMGRVKTTNFNRTGYPALLTITKISGVGCVIQNHGIRKGLNRLVWESFNGTIPPKAVIGHVNGNKMDNRLENLYVNKRRGCPANPNDVDPIGLINGETWKPMPEWEYKYHVSDFGRVKCLNYNGTGKEYLLAAKLTRGGYYCANTPTPNLVHRLVWGTFRGSIPSRMQVNHINFDKTDNRLSNLELLTPKENTSHYRRSFSEDNVFMYQKIGDRWVLFLYNLNARKALASKPTLEELQQYHLLYMDKLENA